LWETDAELPRGVDPAGLETWWEKGPDAKLAEENLRQACIGIEILAGIESPAEEKQARMAYQMQRLVEGMGSAGAQRSREEQLLDQLNGFIALTPPDSWVERFCAAVETARKHV
jgi:hypothetical protein